MTSHRSPTLVYALCFAAGCCVGSAFTAFLVPTRHDVSNGGPTRVDDGETRRGAVSTESPPRIPRNSTAPPKGDAGHAAPAEERLLEAEAEVVHLRAELESLRRTIDNREMHARQERRFRLAMQGWAGLPGDLPAPHPDLHLWFAKVYSVLERERSGDEMAALYRSAQKGFEAFEELDERSRREITGEDGEVRFVHDPQAAGITAEDRERARETLYQSVMPLLDERERREARRRIVGNE